jgi:hypothetical protein
MEQKQKHRAARSPFPENRLRTRRPSQVDITRILIQLKAQRDHLNIAIAALEDISPRTEKYSGSTKRSARRATKSRRKGRARSSATTQPMGKLIPFRRARRRAASKPFKAEA